MNAALGASGAPPGLSLWADDQKEATLGYDAINDQWSLVYEATWIARPAAFPLSPALAFKPASASQGVSPGAGYASGAIKRFVDNLLPEGRALDITASTYRVSKSNLYALISALGTETTGAFRFLRTGEVPPVVAAAPPREVTREELDQRLADRDQVPLALWDGKVRMSIAGVQDKLMVYLDRPLEAGGKLFLVEPPLASTHILKPDPGRRGNAALGCQRTFLHGSGPTHELAGRPSQHL